MMYSQNGQDIFVKKVCNKLNGYFIDIGAHHPIINNNSYLLEKELNWKGLLVEYLPDFENDYIRLRPNSNYIIQDARTINYRDFLEKNNYPYELDFLSFDLDVDNKSTLDVLNLFNKTVFDNYKFATITFEHDIYTGNYYNTREVSRQILKDRGYILVFPDVLVEWGGYKPFEDWYLHPDLIDINIINKIKTEYSLNLTQIKQVLDTL